LISNFRHILHLPAYEDGRECSETSAYKIQTPGNYPEENIQHEVYLSDMYTFVIGLLGWKGTDFCY